MATKRSLICGVGVNDADYSISFKCGGVYRKCPFYAKWKAMIYRCYSPLENKRNPSYIGCTVSSEWLLFSNFKRWMESQDWQGKHLDKDLLSSGAKIYSPETCCLVSEEVNNFIVDKKNKNGLMTGVSWCAERSMYQAHISDTVLKKNVALGRFKSEKDAHMAWALRKHEIAKQIASKQSDERVSAALLKKFPEPVYR